MGFAAVLSLAGCGSGSNTNATAPPPASAAAASDGEYIAPDAKGVQTITVGQAPIPDYLELPAHIEPDPTRVVHVFAPAGGRIVEMKVRPWDHVEKAPLWPCSTAVTWPARSPTTTKLALTMK